MLRRAAPRLSSIALVAALSAPLLPQTAHAFALDRLAITTGFWSYHESSRGKYNETNTGFGFEYELSPNWTFAAGHYENSVRRDGQVLWNPDIAQGQWGPVRFSAGIAVGLVNGYPELRNGDVSPTILPVASVLIGPVGVNLTYIPSVAGRADGAFALQLKWRFGR